MVVFSAQNRWFLPVNPKVCKGQPRGLRSNCLTEHTKLCELEKGGELSWVGDFVVITIFFQTGFQLAALADLELTENHILLPPECWD